MAGNPKRVGVVVGLGSVGRRHALTMQSRYERNLVIDPDGSAAQQAEEILGSDVEVFRSLPEAHTRLRDLAPQVTAVVSNWGPDHFDTFSFLVDAGVRRILVEKPLAGSISDAWTMVDLTVRHDVRAIVGTARRYNGLIELVRATFAEVDDAPVALVGHGGAQCVVTTGMHWLDFACGIFEENPSWVQASLEDDGANPRSPELGFWSGSAAWGFSGARSAVLTYSNQSSVSGTVAIYGRNSRLDISSSDELSFSCRNAAEVQQDPRVTRCGAAELITLLPPPGSQVSSTALMLDVLDSDTPLSFGLAEAAPVAEALLAALVSSDRGSRIELPLDQGHPDFQRKWPAS